ncbi:hypothetical protein AB0M86_49540 [Streptomyces sp. NPDC051639]|uniref:hypothetical protein n=1 Tax=Streptomyces sp. NPDC051639 TaxID=3155671 RepID=UPI00344A91D5
MSTPAQASDEERPFDPHDFPQKLRDAQLRAVELYAEIRASQARLPWSREPHDGWPEVTERGRSSEGRAPSPGWKPADAAAYDKLWEELREATAAVQTHGWWKTCQEHGVQGADLVVARQALKHASGVVPNVLERGDVTATA